MLVLLSFISVISGYWLDHNNGCESMWVGHNSEKGDPSCYQVFCFEWVTLTWEEGKTFCNAKVVDHATAHLVSIDSDEVNELVCTADFVKYRF